MDTDVTPQDEALETGNFATEPPLVYGINAMELVELCNQGFITKTEVRRFLRLPDEADG